ncbi:MAG TPA: hypothetical protein PKI55_12965 [Chitinophagaceae bacterium]|nr:hypothetical protein [Chitinophagaceae bacterium]
MATFEPGKSISTNMNIFQRLTIALFKEKAKRKIFTKALSKLDPPNLYPVTDADAVHFKHFGLIGDIIYAIPAMKALAGGKKIHLHLQINQKSLYKKSMQHANKGKILTEKSVEMLAPLLLSQPEFAVCDILTDQKIDYDLDEFRKYPFDYNTNHICRWYFHMYGITADLGKPWLTVTPDLSFSNEIVIARSFRYRAPGISYDFLQAYPGITFVGLKEEYEDMKKAIPALKHRSVANFLEFAQIIAGCRFFIGNQSFPFAVAEGLKVKRALELCFECPNVIPEGKDAYDFCYQPQFEKIVKQLYNS